MDFKLKLVFIYQREMLNNVFCYFVCNIQDKIPKVKLQIEKVLSDTYDVCYSIF